MTELPAETEDREDSGAVVVPLDPPGALEEAISPETVPRRALVVAAHPDDGDFGAAGTVARWTSAGCDVTYCIVTDGAAGAADPGVDLATLAELRQGEQRDAARVVGVEEVVFLGYPDGKLEPTLELRRDLSRVIRTVRPDRVIAQSPQRDYARIRASHPDHLAAGEALLRAVYPDARNPYAHPELVAEGLEPFEVPEVWLMAGPQSDRPVDVTDTFDKKMEALAAHKSQITDIASVRVFVQGWLSASAQRFGLGPDRLVEAFQVVDTR
jgi:LmbE family N-acetylglucosaminyl deacetylase